MTVKYFLTDFISSKKKHNGKIKQDLTKKIRFNQNKLHKKHLKKNN